MLHCFVCQMFPKETYLLLNKIRQTAFALIASQPYHGVDFLEKILSESGVKSFGGLNPRIKCQSLCATMQVAPNMAENWCNKKL